MSKLKEKINIRSIFYLTTIIVILVGTICILILKNVDILNKKVLTSNYDVYYDSTWKIISKDKSNVYLKHNTGSILRIKIITIDNYTKYEDINSSIDNILYSIKKSNNKLQLINRELVKINNNDAYKVLYKKNNSNVLLTVTKESDKIVLFEYTAKSKYYDLVLDSTNNIINNFRLSHEDIDMSNIINLSKNNIKWYSNRSFDSKLDKNNKYSISSNNYKVDYTIPSMFKITSLDTTKSNFIYDDIDISTRVENMNIYEYLDTNKKKNTVYSNYSYLKKKDKFKEYLNLIDDNMYCYKNTYYVDNKIYENVELMYLLNKNHIFIVKLSSKRVPITKRLIKNINVIKYTNYASNTKRVINSNKLIGILEEYVDKNKKKTEQVIIKLPVSYKEIDHNNNMYQIKYYEDNNIKLKYYKVSNIDYNNKSINKNYSNKKVFGKYKELVKEENFIMDDKEYITYSGYYTNKDKLLINTKVLYYKLKNKYLVIEVENSNDIDEMLMEVTDISIVDLEV